MIWGGETRGEREEKETEKRWERQTRDNRKTEGMREKINVRVI